MGPVTKIAWTRVRASGVLALVQPRRDGPAGSRLMGTSSPLFPKLPCPFHALRLPSGHPVHWPRAIRHLTGLFWHGTSPTSILTVCTFGFSGICFGSGFYVTSIQQTAFHPRPSTPSTPSNPQPSPPTPTDQPASATTQRAAGNALGSASCLGRVLGSPAPPYRRSNPGNRRRPAVCLVTG